jgi:hypothetical protein
MNQMQKSSRARPKPKSRNQSSEPAPASEAGHNEPDGAPEKSSEVNPSELAMVERYLERQKKRTVPSMKVTKVAGKNMLAPDHQNEDVGNVLLMDALGTASLSFLNGILRQLVNVGCQGQDAQAADINFMLAMVEGVGPRDQTEAMLAAQMAAP